MAGITSPLPEPDRGGFLSNITRAASDIWSNLKRTISTPFGEQTGNTIKVMFDNPIPTPQHLPGGGVIRSERVPSPMPTATPTPTNVPMPTPTLRPDIPFHNFTPILQKYFPPEELNNAQNVVMGESSFNPWAVNANKNGSKDYGLFQINDIHAKQIKDLFGYSMNDLFDPLKNIEVASWLWKQQGWTPWVAAKGLGLAGK